jgi:hypothetical protein
MPHDFQFNFGIWVQRNGGFLFGAPLIGTLAHMMPLDRALLAV